MFSLILKQNWQSGIRYFYHKPVARIITALLFFSVFGATAFGIYLLSLNGFKYILTQSFFKDALLLYIYEIFLAIVMLLVLFSCLISGIFQLFGSESDKWIISSPRFLTLPYFVYFRIFLTSLWPIIIIVIPVLFALHSTMNLSVIGMIIALFSLVILTGVIVFGTMAVILLVSKILFLIGGTKKSKILNKANLIFVLFLLFIFCSYLIWHQIKKTELITLFQAENLQVVQAGVSNIINQFHLLPSHLSALTVYFLTQARFQEAITPLIYLLILFIVICVLLWRFSFWYLPLWQVLQEGNLEAGTEIKVASNKPVRFPKILKGAVGALFEKEILLTFRTMQNLLWFFFILFLWLMQAGLNFYLGYLVKSQQPLVLPLIVRAFQIVTAIYFISALALRFVFPAFSAETRSIWVIATAPIKLQKVFWIKFIFYSIVFSIFAVIIGVLNSSALSIGLVATTAFLILLVISVITVTGFGLSLGTVFPNFETDNPEILSTSLPGLAFIVFSLGYGALGALYFYNFLKYGYLLPIIIFEIISLILIFIFLGFASRSLEKIDFTPKRI